MIEDTPLKVSNGKNANMLFENVLLTFQRSPSCSDLDSS